MSAADGQPAVPFLDVGATYRELSSELDAATTRVLQSGWFLLGRELEAFESSFAAYVGAPYAVGVGNGLDALILALRALGVGPGDEVIVPSNTYIATWLAVTEVGARLVPVEPDPTTYNIDAAGIEPHLTERTRAVLPVHLYGRPVDMVPVIDLARRHDLLVVEDAAQAHGAILDGRRIGSHGDAVGWSFYPGKNLGAFGDGGAVTTSEEQTARRVRQLGNYGSNRKYVNDLAGINSRLDEIQAAALAVKLTVLDEWNERRRSIANRYLDAFSGHLRLVLPRRDDTSVSAWHLFVVRHPERDRLQEQLAADGVNTLVHYPIPPHRQQAYAGFAEPGAYPIANELAATSLSLPIGPHLTASDVDRVIDAVLRHA